jgi:hypothetical protein
LLLLFLASTLSSCLEGTTREVLATILAVDGRAMSSSNFRKTPSPLAAGALVGKAEIIETTDSSRVAIALLPNLLIQLDRDARAEILRLKITKDGNETAVAMQGRYADVKLMKGRIFVSQIWGEAIAGFTLITPHGELVTSSNALFCVESDENKTRVTCVSGSVRWRRREGDAVTRMAPSSVGEFSASESNMLAAESDLRGQEDLQEGLEVEEKLRFLISQKRYVLPR